MKNLSRLILTLAVLFLSHQSLSAVTADNLAVYFGVSSWTTVVALPPESFTAEIYEIKDGAIAGRVLAGDRRWTKTSEGALTIMVGTESGKYKIVVTYQGGVTVSTATPIDKFNSTVSVGLPARVEQGDYVLFGQPIAPQGHKSTTDVSAYSSGFVLRVRPI